MNALRTLGGLAFGFPTPAPDCGIFPPASGPLLLVLGAGAALMLAASRLCAPPAIGVAEVAVAFDGAGQVADRQIRRSSGSPSTDAAAVDAALELAALRRPADVAGRTLLFKANFDAAARAE